MEKRMLVYLGFISLEDAIFMLCFHMIMTYWIFVFLFYDLAMIILHASTLS